MKLGWTQLKNSAERSQHPRGGFGKVEIKQEEGISCTTQRCRGRKLWKGKAKDKERFEINKTSRTKKPQIRKTSGNTFLEKRLSIEKQKKKKKKTPKRKGKGEKSMGLPMPSLENRIPGESS